MTVYFFAKVRKLRCYSYLIENRVCTRRFGEDVGSPFRYNAKPRILDKIRKKRVVKEWWAETLRQYRPEEKLRLEEDMKKRRNRLFSSFVGREDGVELADTLRDLITNCYAYAHYAGIRRGYLIARQLQKLESEKRGGRAKAKIAQLIGEHPNYTTKQIFMKLDNAEIPVFWVGKGKKHVRLWSELGDEPAYKMLVSRIRTSVRQKTRVRHWRRIMRKHDEFRSSKPHGGE